MRRACCTGIGGKEPARPQCLFNRHQGPYQQRFAVVGVVLGILVTAAFFIGSPMFGNFDQLR